MLYVTTRGQQNVFTGHWAMNHESDRGQLIPRQFPSFNRMDLRRIADSTFNENVAYILDLLYRERITPWDVDMALGKHPMDLVDLNSRTLAARLWWGSDRSFNLFVDRLFRIFSDDPMERPGSWFTLCVRAAVIVGVLGKLMADGLVSEREKIDISVPSWDFQFPMAAWYVRSWGMPIGRIICCCNENNAPWVLMNQEELRGDNPVVPTIMPACDQAAPAGLERLIYEVLGQYEAERYGTAMENGGRYRLEESQRRRLRKEIAVSVVSQRRLRFLLPNLFRDGQWMDPYAAMSYAGLVDHRARSGDTGRGLIICQEDPILYAPMLARELGITEEALRQRLGRL